MPPIRAAFFDVDGVLLDSLEPHLRICRDKSREFGLSLRIPSAAQFRAMVRRGVVISPMKQFFLAVGFPEQLAARADRDYRREFFKRYGPRPFPGAVPMLERLAAARVGLGIVTSNTRRIVVRSLGAGMRLFDPHAVFTVDDGGGASKAEALVLGAREFGVPVSDIIYVGDQPKDHEAARQAGAQFLGVTYGWGISKGDDAPTVNTPGQVATYLVRRLVPAKGAPVG